MTLLLRLPGRGNREAVVVTFTGRHAASLLIARVCPSFTLGGQTYRIVKADA